MSGSYEALAKQALLPGQGEAITLALLGCRDELQRIADALEPALTEESGLVTHEHHLRVIKALVAERDEARAAALPEPDGPFTELLRAEVALARALGAGYGSTEASDALTAALDCIVKVRQQQPAPTPPEEEDEESGLGSRVPMEHPPGLPAEARAARENLQGEALAAELEDVLTAAREKLPIERLRKALHRGLGPVSVGVTGEPPREAAVESCEAKLKVRTPRGAWPCMLEPGHHGSHRSEKGHIWQ